MRFVSTFAVVTVSAIALSACGGQSSGDSRDFVRIVGSSTVYPLHRRSLNLRPKPPASSPL